MKKIIYFLVVIIGLGWIAYSVKDKIAKSAVEKAVMNATGLKLDIGSLSLGLIKTELTIKDLRFFNPQGFKEPVMIDLPYAYMDYNFADLLKKNIHIENMEIDLKEFFVIKDKNGNLNINALNPVKSEKTKGTSAVGSKEKEQLPAVRIDNLLLKIGKVHYLDYSKDPASPARSEFTLNFKGSYSNITNLGDLVKLIVGKAVFDSALNNLVNLDAEGLKTAAEATAASSAEGAAEKTGESILNIPQGAAGGNVSSQETK